jgi:hypothetical protein
VRIENRRRRGFARFGLVLAVVSAVAVVMAGVPANAADRAQSLPKVSATVMPSDIIGNEVVKLANVNSGLCLAYDPQSRGAARQEGCGVNDDNTTNWELASNGSGAYELIDLHNNQCLSISGGSTADGAAAFVYNCLNTTDQLFTLVPQFASFPGSYELVNVHSGKCVAVGGGRTNYGAWVIQWTCNASAPFMWRPF